MKKIVLTLASVLAATAFAPEAAAVPAFARQTGMACNSCHFQTYPALTAFGRSFKIAGYTMMGSQGKVEGEHGLSIPDTLNSALYVQWRYIKTNGSAPATAPSGASTNYGRVDMPDEFALFMGGRVSDNIGFLTEIALATSPAAVANAKMPILTEAGDMKVGIIPFTNAGHGPAGGFDLFATGSTGAGRINENGMGYSAALYMGSSNNGPATGIAFVAANDTFHVDISPWTAAGAGASGYFSGVMKATYLRAGWTPNISGWDVGVGIQNWSGDSSRGATFVTSPASTTEDKLMVIDGQAQGELNGMPTGFYASYGTAAASTAAKTNSFNVGTKSKTALGLMADVWVMPGTLGLQVGMMRAKTGLLDAAGAAETDNSITLGARYKIRQNVKVGLAYTKFSGTAYNTTGSGGANSANYSTAMAGTPERGTSRLTLILSAGL